MKCGLAPTITFCQRSGEPRERRSQKQLQSKSTSHPAASKSNGGYDIGETPLPIPNREVKPYRAYGTAFVGGRAGNRLNTTFRHLAALHPQPALGTYNGQSTTTKPYGKNRRVFCFKPKSIQGRLGGLKWEVSVPSSKCTEDAHLNTPSTHQVPHRST